ncbi:MAG: nitroreductase family protein [Bacteroidales bacterium]|jgi:nitroreductase|nr:nitroreductase family protein [Bacteroidales bacterium]
MELLEGIITRRSIRKYTDAVIPREKAEELIRYGMYAPSAHNRRPWHFVLLDDKKIFSRILEFQPYTKMLANAQWGIVVCGDDMLSLTPEYWPVDCAAATENILLAAHGMGYGAVWLGIYPRSQRVDAMKDLLNLPEHIHAFSIISVGVAGQHIAPPELFYADRIHLNKWQATSGE